MATPALRKKATTTGSTTDHAGRRRATTRISAQTKAITAVINRPLGEGRNISATPMVVMR